MEESQPPPAEAPKPAPKGKGLWIGIAVVVVVVVVLLAAVLGGLFGPPEERVLKVGTVLSITGSLAAFGGKNRQGVILAAEEINTAGGVLGQAIQLFHQDDQTLPDPARAAASTLISQNRVDAIIGATGSGQCATVVAVAKANGVFEVSGSCTSPVFSNTSVTDGWWARTAPSDALQGVVAAEYLATNLSYARAAVIGIDNPYGRGLAQVFFDNFERFGGSMVANPEIVPGIVSGSPPPDYTTNLETILNTAPAPEVLYIVAYPPEGIQIVKNFETAKGANPAWASIDLVFSEGVFDQTGFLDVLAGAPNNYTIAPYFGTAPSAYGGLTGPNYDAWASDYDARWGGAPGLFDDNNYDAMYLIALAAQAAGSATGAAIKSKIFDVANPPGTKVYPGQWTQALAALTASGDVDYEGSSGSVNIDSLGDPLSGYIVWGVNDTTDRWEVDEIYPEALVVSLLPAPPALIPPANLQGSMRWEAVAPTRD
jgi:ABC-type branched-subunit amino acid transport system substrate-binding protein